MVARSWLLITFIFLFLGLTPAHGDELGHPGYLIISAARDTSAGFQWIEGPGPQQISLTWLDGMLTVPDSLVIEEFSRFDLAIPVKAEFSGAGTSGKLEWREGTYDINEPLMITDGVVSLLVDEGELEVLEQRIRYRAPDKSNDDPPVDPRASFIMLGGILLLIGVLLRRARHTLNKGA